MTGSVSVAGLEPAAGERTTRIVNVPLGTQTARVPVAVINGAREGPQVAITAGIHGAEYPGIEAARRLATSLDPHELTGSVVVVPISSPVAFHRRTIYVSGVDNQNINRVFPGNPSGTPTERLADWLFRTIIRPSQYYIDLHGGDMIEAIVPFVLYAESEDKRVEAEARAMAFATGVPCVVFSPVVGSTYAAATEVGIPGICQEIGGQGVWNEDVVEQHLVGVRRVLRHLGVLPGTNEPLPEPRVYTNFPWVRSQVDGLFHPLVRVGDRVTEGETIGRVTDYFGNELQSVDAPCSGEVVFLVTSLAMNAGDPLLAVGA